MNDVEFMNVKYGKLNPVGEFVLIERMDPVDLKMSDGIYIPESDTWENNRIGIGKIVQISEAEAEKLGVNVDDIVMYDFHSAHNTKDKVHITKSENIFMTLTPSEAVDFLNGTLSV
jgi:co-chaperonin GroES (HSP10)